MKTTFYILAEFSSSFFLASFKFWLKILTWNRLYSLFLKILGGYAVDINKVIYRSGIHVFDCLAHDSDT